MINIVYPCGCVPVLYFALYYLALILTQGIEWSVHLWTGSIILAGMVGLLPGFLLLPAAQRGQALLTIQYPTMRDRER
jgi:hypothetical protein